ncbi:MAG: SDR family NAD(P)-dependent oxidoreductase [Alphaproteobacteria bacterium]|nr:SDR family NAD(P)-dependent oxidoreductase [Alphaproteobacteria bacterium]
MANPTYPLTTDFTGIVVCITGATAGIGLACAEAFLESGASVIGTGRRKERLDVIAKKYGNAFTPLVLDVTRRDDVFSALAGEQVDILVNNAGLALGLEKAAHGSLEDWETMIDTNIKGVLYCTKTLLPEMVARNHGHIINIGSIAGTYPYPGGNVYGATKAFLKQFSLNLRADLLGKPIRVTNIEPGMVHTEFSKVRFKDDDARAEALYEGVAALTAQDIAQNVLWAASLPTHVNINRIEVMPTQQASAPLAVHREVTE